MQKTSLEWLLDNFDRIIQIINEDDTFFTIQKEQRFSLGDEKQGRDMVGRQGQRRETQGINLRVHKYQNFALIFHHPWNDIDVSVYVHAAVIFYSRRKKLFVYDTEI